MNSWKLILLKCEITLIAWMFIIVFVLQNITFDNNKIIKLEIKFKTLNVLIFNVTIVVTITAIAKIDIIFWIMTFYVYEQNDVLLIQQRFFLNQKNVDVIKYHQFF